MNPPPLKGSFTFLEDQKGLRRCTDILKPCFCKLTRILKISNFNELDIPVDARVAGFTFYTGAVKIKGQSFQGCVYEDLLRGIIKRPGAANKLNIYPWKLDEPIWTIGSSLCAKWNCRRCPVEDLCEKVRGYRIVGGNLTWKRSL